jgi:anaerobic magnesium-protoporphyrin IX monomethyl ester cyclase
MTDLVLVYPYFNDDNSIFKFPPLGLGYIASYIRNNGFSVGLVDCTFMREEEAVAKVKSLKPRVLGISIMSTMKDTGLRLARRLRSSCDLLVAGGPLPTASPEEFVSDFDLVVMGEGEETVLEILKALDAGRRPNAEGIAYREGGRVVLTPLRGLRKDLDSLPLPARDLFDHVNYKNYFKKHHGYTITSMITSRGCPFDCEFCSRSVFGNTYRSLSHPMIADEVEEVMHYGYDRIWIGDDLFPMSKKLGMAIFDEIIGRGLDVRWECLCRVDVIDGEVAARMKRAGCYRSFFGIESGNDCVLRLMNKMISVDQARKAVYTVYSAGIRAGAFFILGYPGETNKTMLDTISLASSLPLDYLSFTVPYPIPGTKLHERVKQNMISDDMKKVRRGAVRHALIYRSEFSMNKLKFGILKAMAQYHLRQHLGSGYTFLKPFEKITGCIFKALN